MATVQEPREARSANTAVPRPFVARVTQRPAVLTVLPLVILIYSFMFLPVEVKLTFAGQNIYSYRIAIILLTVPALRRLIEDARSLGLIDAVILASCTWTLVAFSYRLGFQGGFVRAFAIFIDTFGAYVIARTSIRSFSDLRILLILISPAAAFAGLFLVIESVSGQLIIRPFFASIFGAAIAYEGGVGQGALQLLQETRLGLLRAYSSFSYPILGGTILASLMPLYLSSGVRSWPFFLGVGAAAAAVFSLSSAAFICLMLGIGLVILDRLMPRLRPLSWHFVIALAGAYGVLANLGLQGGIVGVLSRVTLNPATAYIRRLQWQYGSESVMQHPFFGIGFDEYVRASWMTAAIDAHFLNLGIRDGLLTPVLLLLACVLIMLGIGRRARGENKQTRNLLIGLNFTIAVLLVSSMTVTYFSEANIWFMAVLGFGTACTTIPRTVRVFRPAGQKPNQPASRGPENVQLGAHLRAPSA